MTILADLLEAGRVGFGAIGLRVGADEQGRCEGRELRRTSHCWFVEDEPVVDTGTWDRLVGLWVDQAKIEKRNRYLEKDLAVLDRAELELRRSQSQAWTMFDATAAVMFLEDRDGRFLIANSFAEALFDRDREDLKGELTDDFLPWMDHAALRRQVIETASQSVFEADRPSPDLEQAFLGTKFPMFGDDGEVHAVGTILFDISARRESARALEESERSYREIFEKASDLILIHAIDGTIVAANHGLSALGYEPQQVIGRTLDSLSAASEGLGNISLADALNNSSSVVWPLLARDGATLWFQFRASRTHIMGEERFLTIARDVTREKIEEQRRVIVEENLYRAQRYDALGRLASGVAHEFNNLLSVILSYSDLAARDLADSPALDDIVNIQDAASRAAGLVRKLTALGRRRNGTPVLTDIGHQVEHLRDLLHRSLGEHVNFTLHIDTAPQVRLDPAQLDRILVNLTLHSKEVPPPGARFKISVREANAVESASIVSETGVVVVIEDWGRGHTAAEVEDLFEPFWSGVEGETHIGLATAYSTLIHLGGAIQAEADAKMTRFTMIFPAADDISDSPIRTVLLTDDEPLVLTTLRNILEFRGWQVLTARSGEEALAAAARFDGNIDILLTDVVMPHMSGTQLAKRLRLQRPGLRVLYMSGYAGVGREGNDLLGEVIIKPFSTSQLLESIERNIG